MGKQLVKGGEVRRGDAATSGDFIAEKSRHCQRKEVGRGRGICSLQTSENLQLFKLR